jgi:hypothetical protein
MSSFTYQVIKDTTEHAVIKLTARFTDTTQESNNARIAANTLYGALDSSKANLLSSSANTGPLSYYGLAVNRVWYDCASEGDVELYWDADSDKSILFLNGNGEYDGMGNWVTIPNNAKGTANCRGDIGITTRGMIANSSYTIVIELRKENEYYQRGQFNDPAAFNYDPYGPRP